MKIEPYLFFDGNCEEAIEFYKRVLGAETMVMRYKESPEPLPAGMVPPGWDDKVMHANIRVGDAVFMASDGKSEGGPGFKGFSLSISIDDVDKGRQIFDALAAGGQVVMPLGKTFYSPMFGMVTDRYGVLWMVIKPQQ
jgi:PhnB protein